MHFFVAPAQLLQRAVALYPARAETWLELGDMALKRGRKNEARQSYARYVDRREKGVMTVAARLWDAGDLPGAVRFYERALGSRLLDGRQKALAE